MTFSGLIIGIFMSIFIAGFFITNGFKTKTKIISIIISFICIWGGLLFFFNCTASGRRSVVDMRSELNNGLEREINVYTADGNIIAHYEGKIDLEDNDGGYVIFDYEGKRYTYYNCFVESIANIK